MSERFDRLWQDRRQPNDTSPAHDRRSGSDRRQNQRISLRLELAVPVLLKGDFGLTKGVARNISEGGILVEVRQSIPIGASIEIEIQGVRGSLDSPESLNLQGEVRHQVAWQHTQKQIRHTVRAIGIRFVAEEVLERAPVSHWIWKTGHTLH